MWECITSLTSKGYTVTHIVPADDMYGHELSSQCWCCPDLDEEHWTALHHSGDDRESFELGRRKPS